MRIVEMDHRFLSGELNRLNVNLRIAFKRRTYSVGELVFAGLELGVITHVYTDHDYGMVAYFVELYGNDNNKVNSIDVFWWFNVFAVNDIIVPNSDRTHTIYTINKYQYEVTKFAKTKIHANNRILITDKFDDEIVMMRMNGVNTLK